MFTRVSCSRLIHQHLFIHRSSHHSICYRCLFPLTETIKIYKSNIITKSKAFQFIHAHVFSSKCDKYTSNQNQDDKNMRMDPNYQNDHSSTTANESILTQIRSIPNMITLTRIVGTPAISYLIIHDEYRIAAIGCMIAGFTDWLDGYIAKNFNKTTVLGTYLDPLADKWTIFVLSSTLAYQGLLPPLVVFIWIGRDVGLIAATYYHVSISTRDDGRPVIDPARTPLKVEPSNLSKANTVLQFLTIALAIGYPIGFVPPTFTSQMLDGLCWITASTTIASGLQYSDGKSLRTSGNDTK